MKKTGRNKVLLSFSIGFAVVSLSTVGLATWLIGLQNNKVVLDNINVVVGEVKHPMLENHYIEAIIIETNKQLHVKELKPGDDPVFNITLESDEKPLRVLEYCNLHGLWGVEL